MSHLSVGATLTVRTVRTGCMHAWVAGCLWSKSKEREMLNEQTMMGLGIAILGWYWGGWRMLPLTLLGLAIIFWGRA